MLLFGYTIAESAETQRNGVVFVYDLTGFGIRHVKAMKPSRLTQLVRMMQDGAPGKIKGIHLVFHPRVFGAIYQLVKPFLKEKITKRVLFVIYLQEFIDDHNTIKLHNTCTLFVSSVGPLSWGRFDFTSQVFKTRNFAYVFGWSFGRIGVYGQRFD